jgi:hypothetical protein
MKKARCLIGTGLRAKNARGGQAPLELFRGTAVILDVRIRALIVAALQNA